MFIVVYKSADVNLLVSDLFIFYAACIYDTGLLFAQNACLQFYRSSSSCQLFCKLTKPINVIDRSVFATCVLHVVVEMCIDYCMRYELWDACVKDAQPYLKKQSSVKSKDHTVCWQFDHNRYLRFL